MWEMERLGFRGQVPGSAFAAGQTDETQKKMSSDTVRVGLDRRGRAGTDLPFPAV